MLPDIGNQRAMFRMNKILVIESDTLLLGLIEEWLVLHDFNPIIAETCQQGYQLALLEEPDLILSCYKLFGCDGLELLQQLRKEPKTRTIPFVLVTGMESIEIPDYLFKPNQMIRKPFLAKNLLRVIHSQLRSIS